MPVLETGAPAAVLLGVLGLLVGSFLNVVIHRLPKMMERQWAAECAELQGKAPAEDTERYNLLVPRSACPHCGHRIRWFENIPVLSFLALRGKCSQCGAGIGWRYPGVELLAGLLFAWSGWRWGLGASALMWCGFAAAVLALACIDWDTTLLPDDITLPLLWAGLVAAALALTPTTLPDALWGAVAGYLSLWLVYWGFKLVTGKEGMGHGDFKLGARRRLGKQLAADKDEQALIQPNSMKSALIPWFARIPVRTGWKRRFRPAPRSCCRCGPRPPGSRASP